MLQVLITTMLIGSDSYTLPHSAMRDRLVSDGFCLHSNNGGFEANNNKVLSDKPKIGGIYQYSGSSAKSSDPPAALAALLGISKHKKSSYKSTKAKRSTPGKATSHTPTTGKADENIDLLERQVLSKYKSSSFKIGAEDEWDEEDIEELRGPAKNTAKFHGFQPSRELYTTSKDDSGGFSVDDQHSNNLKQSGDESRDNRPRSSLSNRIVERRAPADGASSKPTAADSGRFLSGDEIDYEPSERAEEEDAWDDEDLQYLFGSSPARTTTAKKSTVTVSPPSTALTARQTTSVVSTTSAKASAPSVSGFRLRPPAPVDPSVKIQLDAKTAAIAEKERLKLLRREKLLLESKSQFTPFEFLDGDSLAVASASYSNNSTDGGILTGTTFRDLGIKDETVLRNLDRLRLYSPTQIQAQAIPALLSGRPAVLQAQTGSGKTLAFLLPLLEAVDPTRKQVQALILAPSRELVTQIGHVATSLFKDSGYRVVTLIGGANVRNQIKHLREDRPQIVVATPGRLAELVFRLEKIKLGMVRAVVIDEVDNMMQDPYVGEIETILQATPLFNEVVQQSSRDAIDSKRRSDGWDDTMEDITDDGLYDDEDLESDGAVDDNSGKKRLICLASATSNDPAVTSFADRYCGEKMWNRIAVDSGAMLPATITHGLISTTRMRALDMLRRFINAKPAVRSAIIFVNDPHRVEVVVRELHEMGLVAAPLHGDSSKDDRKEIISRLKDGRLRLVVATELAARGLDIPDLSHVINFELPTDAQHYVHRTGRCGRAGRQGLAMNFANPETKFVIRRFGKKLGIKVHDCEIRDGKVFLKMR